MEIVAPGSQEQQQPKDFVMITPETVKLKTDKIALIDADFIKYFVCNAIKKDIENKRAYIFEDTAKKYTQEYINMILDSFECPGYIFCFSGNSSNTFRSAVAFEKKYKGTRTYEPLYDGELQDKTTSIRYIRDRYPTLLYRDLEADDILSMLQDDETFIYSRDKDLLQIPGTHYSLETGQFVEMTKEHSFQFLMKQMITGDVVDNIPGIVGIGEVGAEKILTNVKGTEALMAVLKAYFEKEKSLFNGIDAFVESWNLLRLRNKRGTYFQSRYQSAFDVLQMIKLNAKKNE